MAYPALLRSAAISSCSAELGVNPRWRAVHVGDLHVRAGVDEQAHGLHVRGAAVAEDHRREQGGEVEIADVVELSVRLEQRFHELGIAAPGGADQRGASLGVLRVHVRPVVEQELEHAGSGPISLEASSGASAASAAFGSPPVRAGRALVDPVRGDGRAQLRVQLRVQVFGLDPGVVAAATAGHEEREHDDHTGEKFQATLPRRTQPLWPPRPITFESATSSSTSRASFGT